MLQISSNARFDSWESALASATGEVREALLGFRSLLSNRWHGWKTGAPLAMRFSTGFQGLPAEGVRLWQLVQSLDGMPNRDLVARALGSRSWCDFNAAVMTLRFASSFRSRGREVAFVAQENESAADALIEVCERDVLVEYKALHRRDERKPWDTLIDTLAHALVRRKMNLADFRIELDHPALEHPESLVDGLARIHSEEMREFSPLPNGAGRARRVGGVEDDLPGVCIPVTQHHDIVRLGLRLPHWAKKLRQHQGPTLLVVELSHTFFDGRPVLGTASAATAHLSPIMVAKPTISALLLYEEPFLPPMAAESVRTDQFVLSTGSSNARFARVALLIPNPSAKVPLSDAEGEALVGENMLW